MKWFTVCFVVLLGACGSITQEPIEQIDYLFQERIIQLEKATSELKTETLEEARDVAADLVADATKDLEDTGKEVISHAVEELDHKVSERLDQIETIIDTQREKSAEDIRDLLTGDLPLAVEKSLVNTADKLAERLGAVKKTVPGPDGTPIEVWGAAGGGVLALLLALVNLARNYLNNKSGKKRWSEEEFEKRVEEKVGKCLNLRS